MNADRRRELKITPNISCRKLIFGDRSHIYSRLTPTSESPSASFRNTISITVRIKMENFVTAELDHFAEILVKSAPIEKNILN